MFVNGIVVQSYVDNAYRGIDGSGFGDNSAHNWFLNYDERVSEYFEPYYDENIDKIYWNSDDTTWIAACNEMNYIYNYVKEAEKRNIKYRLLLCETDVPYPRFDCPEFKKTFLGYDYAYPSGDNYSAVYNEIPYVFHQFQLNQYGLFQTREEIEKYIAERERFKLTQPPLTLEVGEFVIFKLHEIFLR
ncbi:hypothetical protein [Ruminococcus sp.]|uniref:hypothetical protein n=1 Tax=Ruminococcus sp. TaxID=41978 RepID=UPI001B619571|nr:hypothetical protein [Ruminococcus sp.]MBP5433043.1 hypothetical protein [Ruminococcus sp.]